MRVAGAGCYLRMIGAVVVVRWALSPDAKTDFVAAALRQA